MFPQSKPDFQVFRACPLDPVTVLGMDKLMWVGFLEPVPYQGFWSLSLIRACPLSEPVPSLSEPVPYQR